MKHFLNINDLGDLNVAVQDALTLKENPFSHEALGKRKTICLLFFNNSLRTRLSTQKAAIHLGLNTMVMNFGQEGWQLEFEDGTVMNHGNSEHVREAAQVVSQFADIIAIRAFAGLVDRQKDEAEKVVSTFCTHATIPVVNMESSTGHPLQAFADAITMAEHVTIDRPKVVLSWAPHPKALPHAVANSFVKMMKRQDAEFIITNPEGYDLDPKITEGCTIIHDQTEALKNADVVYVKNWSSYEHYGKVLTQDPSWMMTKEKLGNAAFMHCLPVRRNVVVEDAVLDSKLSLVIEQANNRTFAAQLVLKRIIQNL